MKKILFIFITIIILTGCSSEKTLKCTYSDENINMKTYNSHKYTFDDKGLKIQKLDIKMEYEFKDAFVKEINNSGSSIKDQIDTEKICGSYKNDKNIKCDYKISNNKIVINISGKFEENNPEIDKTYDEVKKYYEGKKYECK